MSEHSKNFKDAFVEQGKTIVEAMRIIDNAALQIALVVDDDEKLLGTVTDGDIRRGILAGIPLEGNITKIMNAHPTTVKEGASVKEIMDLMTARKIYQVPVLDDQGRVVELERLRVLLDRQEHEAPKKPADVSTNPSEVTVFLMLGGEGKRLHPLTKDIPKPMISVGGRPLAETIVSNFVAQGFTKFYFSLNYKADMIRDHFGDGSEFGAQIQYVLEDEPRGTAGSLSLIPEHPKGPLIVMNGDLLTNVNFAHMVGFHHENKVMATMCVREYTHEIPYGIVENDGTKLGSIIEKPSHSYFVNAGIYVLNPEVLNLVPREGFFDMPGLFEKIRAIGGESAVFPIREYWLDIGRFEDLERAREEYAEVFGSPQTKSKAG